MASPRPSVWLSLAKLSTAPSAGPMQGVQPKANAIPMTGGAHTPSLEGATATRRRAGATWDEEGRRTPTPSPR